MICRLATMYQLAAAIKFCQQTATLQQLSSTRAIVQVVLYNSYYIELLQLEWFRSSKHCHYSSATLSCAVGGAPVATGISPSGCEGLRLRLKVGHWLLNLCDCDSVLSERCRQSNPQDFKNNNNNNNPKLLRSCLNFISNIWCSKRWTIFYKRN